MATWVGAHTNLAFELNLACVTDGTNIYGNSLTEAAIKMYAPADDSLTTISDGVVTSGTLKWFRGHLYALRSGEGNSYIYRWNGGQNWSLVHTISPTLIEAAGVLVYTPVELGWSDFMTDGKYLVLVQDYYGDDPAITSADEHGVYVSYTVNGTNWGQGSINATNHFIIPYSEDRSHFIGTPYHPAEVGLATVIRTASETDKVFQFVNGQLQEKASAISGTLYYAFSDRKYFWRRDTPLSQGAPVEDNVAYSVDLANWTATTLYIVPIRNNCLAPLGYGVDTTLNQIDLYLWDGSDWVLSPSDTNGISGTVVDFGANYVDNFIRLKDGTCYAFVGVDSGGSPFWKVRSDPLGGPGRPPEEQPYAAARFYSGEESLTERSQLPFSEVGPGGLDVRGDRIAAVGNHQPGQPVVALASAETDFSDWLDHSGSVPTDGQVTSLRWVIPGTVTDTIGFVIY
jgi:hypothetical protein